jgi:imidazolonepropionase-like amidohydrolase
MDPTCSFPCRLCKLVGYPSRYNADEVEEFTVRSAILDAQTLLRQATINPAKMLKQEGRLGIIAPGALADLLILDKNPLLDITVLDRPELYLKAVYKEGRLYKDELHL